MANAYLLCRVIDTIEDEVSLSPEQKKYFCTGFIEVVKNNQKADDFSLELTPLLSEQTIRAEHVLIHFLPRVVQITHKLDLKQMEAIFTCVETMTEGMASFQSQELKHGLPTLVDLNKYCYCVAGCVGEMLTQIFCHYSTQIDLHSQELMSLSASFGQGLQMTNILKDIWEDAGRGVCWLPQDIFTQTGFNLQLLNQKTSDETFKKGLEQLIQITQGHLDNALKYTQLIPAQEKGIRNFCLWAIGMALLTLKKIKKNIDFKNSQTVKISRKSVAAIMYGTQIIRGNNTLLSLAFQVLSKDLKVPY